MDDFYGYQDYVFNGLKNGSISLDSEIQKLTNEYFLLLSDRNEYVYGDTPLTSIPKHTSSDNTHAGKMIRYYEDCMSYILRKLEFLDGLCFYEDMEFDEDENMEFLYKKKAQQNRKKTLAVIGIVFDEFLGF